MFILTICIVSISSTHFWISSRYASHFHCLFFQSHDFMSIGILTTLQINFSNAVVIHYDGSIVDVRNNQYCKLGFESPGAFTLHTCGWSCVEPFLFHLSPCNTLALENWVKQNAAECGTGRGDFRGSAELRFYNECGTEMWLSIDCLLFRDAVFCGILLLQSHIAFFDNL